VRDYLVRLAKVKNLDETGFRVAGKTAWLHVVCNDQATSYDVQKKRGAIPENVNGTVVTDFFKAYFAMKGVTHALCGAHLLRELKSLIEIEKEDWAKHMQWLLRRVSRAHHKDHKDPKDQKDSAPTVLRQNRLSRLYDAIVLKGLKLHESLPAFAPKPKRGAQKKRVGHNLLVRLRDHKDDVLRSLFDPLVPFTNNLAEQAVRMMKVKQKISGGSRTKAGAEVFANIRGFISTARKQGMNLLDAIANPVAFVFPPSANPEAATG
jgi:transposase